ncbi:hypothetical protein [Chryseobacterium sp. SIMBA_028]|uniref:hypothetical protein n=2 Tax=Bacteria TaxID=2 RepID=UPI00397DE870
MEQLKSFLDSSIAFIGVAAALIAVVSWYAGKKVDAEKAIEEERLKTRIAEATAESETARKEAAKANESIAKTDLKAQELELEILNQKDKADHLSLELETQKEKTVNAEKELLLLRKQVKQRTISESTKDSIVHELSKHTSQNIKISSRWGDGEARTYASEIANLFIAAGWKTNINGIDASPLTGSGIVLLNKTLLDNRIEIISDVFSHNEIEFQFHEDPKMDMLIFVGTKVITS